MALRSKLFHNDRLLEACLVQDSAHITLGASGDHVAKVQLALQLLERAQLDAADLSSKSYGRSTAAAVLSFKSKRGIINRAYQSTPDNIVGKMTIAALDKEMFARENPPQSDADEVCCNGDPVTDHLRQDVTHRFTQQFKELAPVTGFAGARPGPGLGLVGASPLSFGAFDPFAHFRRISALQIAVATAVFGASIDYTFVFLSDLRGAEGRSFTVAFGAITVMNCGTFTPKDGTLIHELVHVWQSQHHSKPAAFMDNSISSQALAVAENRGLALIDPTIKTDKKFPTQFPRSPYACVTGLPFREYAAEQIAKQVERNFGAGSGTPIALATDAIVAHIKAASSPRTVDADNVSGLSTARTADKRTTGALF